MVFIELPTFTADIISLVSDEDYQKFQEELIVNPDKGDLIKETGGLRKVRISVSGHGKRGGGRVIYYWKVSTKQILMITCYPKNVQADLTVHQKKVFRAVVEGWNNEK